MKKINYCFHMHTYRCGHAHIVEDENYVINAIKAGYQNIGFSDHVMVPYIIQERVRGSYEECFDSYLESISGLRNKYHNNINIKIGFEAEYSKELKDYYQYLLETRLVDYLIMGQHFYFEDNHFIPYFRGHGNKAAIYHYLDDLLEGMESGLFKYVAHPDIYMQEFDSFNEDCEDVAKKICEAANKYHMPLEINLEGMRDHKHYPCKEFWRVVGQYNCQVVIGLDLHDPDNFFDEESMKKALDLVDEFDLKLIEDYKI